MSNASALLNRLRTRAESWEGFLARPPWRPVKVVSAAYVMLVAVWMATALAGHLFALAELKPAYRVGSDYGFLLQIPAAGLIFYGPLLLVGLVVNLPMFVLLRLARSHVSVGVARCAGAAGLAMWAEWFFFRMEWFDVWRHGIPDARYWV